MSMLGKVCAILTVLGALNWAVGWLTGFDLAVKVLGAERTTGGDALRILVVFSALYLLFLTLRHPKKD